MALRGETRDRRIAAGRSRGLRGCVLALSMFGLAGGALAAQPSAQEMAAKAYAVHCGACHGPDLGGGVGPSIGPALSGPAFVAKWQGAAPGAFVDYVAKTMPLNAPGSLDAATTLAVSNYVRAQNHLPKEKAQAAGKGAAVVSAHEPIKESFGVIFGIDNTPVAAAKERLAALGAKLTPVTDAGLAQVPERDWLAWRGTGATQGYSALRQITRRNVSQLGLSWSLALGIGTNAIAPLVHDGVMFINSNGTVQALDAENGDVIWEHARPATTTRVPSNQTRSMALYGDTLYIPTLDGHMLALEARTGKLVWDHEITKPADDLQLTAAPLAVRGKIIQGVAGCQGATYKGGCFIVALDAKTGAEVWRFHTIARPGEPGGDSWNGAPLEQRFGASVWTTGSYDPELNLVYFGTGQTYIVSTLLKPNAKAGQSRDALYTDTTLAFNPDTGKLVWSYQHAQGDVWDLDWAFERTLVTLPTPSGPRKAVLTSGKTAIIDALDAATGEYLWSFDMGLQSLVTAIDPRTGRKSYDPALTPEVGKMKVICPSTIGARNWPATAYDPTTRLMYLPLVPNCMGLGLAAGTGGSTYRTFGEFMQERHAAPGSESEFGRVAAVDVKTRKIVWTNRYRSPQSSAILATAGGLVFEGGRDRWFRALDSASGKSLWQTRLDNTPNGFPITYSVGGRQYVAIVTGGGSPVDTYLAGFTPEVRSSIGGKTLMVFALPQ